MKLKFPDMSKLPHPREARTKAGMTQEDVRRRAGIGIQTVVRAESSGAWPRDISVLRSYLRALGLAA